MLRTCTVCKKEKSIECFNKKEEGQWHSWCKPCQSTYSKEHYRKNKKRLLELSYKRKAKLRQFVWDLKDNQPCYDCKIKFPHYVMDYDHRPGEIKVNGVAALVTCMVSKEQILGEIKKCDLVCSNCHRKRTWLRKHGPGQLLLHYALVDCGGMSWNGSYPWY